MANEISCILQYVSGVQGNTHRFAANYQGSNMMGTTDVEFDITGTPEERRDEIRQNLATALGVDVSLIQIVP